MPLRRKSSSGRKSSSVTSADVVANGTSDMHPKQPADQSEVPPSQEKRRGSTRSATSAGSSEGESSRRSSSTGVGGGGELTRAKNGSNSKLARTRRGSRDCVIPEDINVSDIQTTKLELCSPTFTIQDFSYESPKSRPITLQRIHSEEKDCISIRDLSESPQRYSSLQNFRKEDPPMSRLSTASSRDDSDGEAIVFHPPSSPLLVAMRTAVDSLNQYEDFEILEEIGAGFFAQVFKVRHKPTGQLMVLKRNKRKTVSLLKEIELLKRLKHANILHYVGACIHEGQLHPLTEYISGGTLEELIQGKDEFRWSTRLHLSLDISRGMGYLHDHGMFHRDLNSRNVLLRRHGHKFTAVVADFGLAAKTMPLTLRNKLTRSQSIVGTPYWMAPEVLNGKPYNESADVFSYGIILCEIISRLSADPDDIPRLKNYALNEEGFCQLPEVAQGSCPREFMELSFMCCKVLPIERPTFNDITTRLYVIRDLHNLELVHRQSLDDTDTIIEPQPPIRLSYHGQLHHSGSLSPTSLLQHSAEFTDSGQLVRARVSRETSV